VTTTLPILRDAATLHAKIQGWRHNGLRVALVPTMGALHDGHLSLVRAALERADRCVTTIFVNPTQFGPNEDFSRYPRQEARDAALLAATGTHLLYAPTPAEMYPTGFATTITIDGPITAGLEGAHRPGHFAGVATVVAKLLLQAGPDDAFFGEKDWQQLQVIRRLVADLNIPVRIHGVPIMREPDGLAMSSRNAYLSPEERARAPLLHAALREAAAALAAGAPIESTLAATRARIAASGFALDYLELTDAETLTPLSTLAQPALAQPARLLVAAHCGRTRLLDNLEVAA